MHWIDLIFHLNHSSLLQVSVQIKHLLDPSLRVSFRSFSECVHRCRPVFPAWSRGMCRLFSFKDGLTAAESPPALSPLHFLSVHHPPLMTADIRTAILYLIPVTWHLYPRVPLKLLTTASSLSGANEARPERFRCYCSSTGLRDCSL